MNMKLLAVVTPPPIYKIPSHTEVLYVFYSLQSRSYINLNHKNIRFYYHLYSPHTLLVYKGCAIGSQEVHTHILNREVYEWDHHCRGNKVRNFVASVQPLLHLIMYIIQGLHGYQKKGVRGIQVIYSIPGKFHGHE